MNWAGASSSGKSRSTNRDFKDCLRNRKIVPFSGAPKLVGKEIAAALEDLEEARDRYQHLRYKYATINSYYAIFHAARALLYSRGFRERGHFCLAVAVDALFVEPGILDSRFLGTMKEGMGLREEADYGGLFSKERAEELLLRADEFLREVRAIFERKRP